MSTKPTPEAAAGASNVTPPDPPSLDATDIRRQQRQRARRFWGEVALERLIGGNRSHEPRPRHGSGYRGPLGELLRDLRAVLYRHGSVAVSRTRAVAAKTRRERRVVMTRMLVDIYRSGLKLGRLKNLRGKHVRSALERWTAAGLAASTLSTYVSHLRSLVIWLEKRELLPIIDDYLVEHPGLTKRRAATDTDKSERGAGIDVGEILRRAAAVGDPHFLAQLSLMAVFGLRAREAWLFRPHLALGELGHVEVTAGTKGGRTRTLPTPLTEDQIAVLEYARAWVPHVSGSMIPSNYARAEQWARRFYALCARIGLTRRGLGATPHSLRHGMLLDLFGALAGIPAPVRREDSSAPMNSERERSVREVIAAQAGHARPQISSAYLGSPRRARSSPESPADDPRAQNTLTLPRSLEEEQGSRAKGGPTRCSLK